MIKFLQWPSRPYMIRLPATYLCCPFPTTLPSLPLPHSKGLLTALQTRHASHHTGPLTCCSHSQQHSRSRQRHASTSFQMSSQMALQEGLLPSKLLCGAVALNFLWVTEYLKNQMKAKKSQKNVWPHAKFSYHLGRFTVHLEPFYIPIWRL